MAKTIQQPEHVWLVMMKAMRALTRYATAGIEDTGLGLSDFGVLEVLLHKGPLPVNTIGPTVGLTPGSISIAVERLVAGHHDHCARRQGDEHGVSSRRGFGEVGADEQEGRRHEDGGSQRAPQPEGATCGPEGAPGEDHGDPGEHPDEAVLGCGREKINNPALRAANRPALHPDVGSSD